MYNGLCLRRNLVPSAAVDDRNSWRGGKDISRRLVSRSFAALTWEDITRWSVTSMFDEYDASMARDWAGTSCCALKANAARLFQNGKLAGWPDTTKGWWRQRTERNKSKIGDKVMPIKKERFENWQRRWRPERTGLIQRRGCKRIENRFPRTPTGRTASSG